MERRLITAEMRSLIGLEVRPATACVDVTATEVRRFAQAIPDNDPLYYDDAYAKKTRYGGIVAPPGLVQVYLGLRPFTVRDPLIDMPDDSGGDSPDSEQDAEAPTWYPGLPQLIARFPKHMRFFHGGDDWEFLRWPAIGDRITCTTTVVDMYEKEGKSGRLGFVALRYTFTNQNGETLCLNRHTEVLREAKAEAAASKSDRAAPIASGPAPPATPASPLAPRLDRSLTFEDVSTGDRLPEHSIRLNVPLIVRWCAATEIFTRRDHFDLAYTLKHTDLKDIVGGGLWSNMYVLHFIKDWAGPGAWVWKFKSQTRSHMFPGDVLTAWARVTKTYTKGGLGYVEMDAGFRKHDGTEVVPANATVVLPLRGGGPVPYPFRP